MLYQSHVFVSFITTLLSSLHYTNCSAQRKGSTNWFLHSWGQNKILMTDEQAPVWNDWSEEETLMQLTRYLRNRALQQWNLFSREDYEEAIKALHARLDPGNQLLEALDLSCSTEWLWNCCWSRTRYCRRLKVWPPSKWSYIEVK